MNNPTLLKKIENEKRQQIIDLSQELHQERERAEEYRRMYRQEARDKDKAEQQAAEERRLRLMQEDSQDFAYLVLQEQTQVLASELEEMERERDELQKELDRHRAALDCFFNSQTVQCSAHAAWDGACRALGDE